MGGNDSAWADCCAVLGFNSLFGFSFDVALFPVPSLDLKKPLLQLLSSVTENEEQMKHNDTVKIIPIDGWSINGHRALL